MKNLELSIASIEELPTAAQRILQFTQGRKVFAFYAEMGAGKTTIIKELCHQLGAEGNLSSPTYSIVNEYLNNNHKQIYHLDLYRLKNISEALAIGIEEYLNSGSYCFIEWAELAETLLPEALVKIYIKTDGLIRNLSIFIQ